MKPIITSVLVPLGGDRYASLTSHANKGLLDPSAQVTIDLGDHAKATVEDLRGTLRGGDALLVALADNMLRHSAHSTVMLLASAAGAKAARTFNAIPQSERTREHYDRVRDFVAEMRNLRTDISRPGVVSVICENADLIGSTAEAGREEVFRLLETTSPQRFGTLKSDLSLIRLTVDGMSSDAPAPVSASAESAIPDIDLDTITPVIRTRAERLEMPSAAVAFRPDPVPATVFDAPEEAAPTPAPEPELDFSRPDFEM